MAQLDENGQASVKALCQDRRIQWLEKSRRERYFNRLLRQYSPGLAKPLKPCFHALYVHPRNPQKMDQFRSWSDANMGRQWCITCFTQFCYHFHFRTIVAPQKSRGTTVAESGQAPWSTNRIDPKPKTLEALPPNAPKVFSPSHYPVIGKAAKPFGLPPLPYKATASVSHT